MYKTNLSLKYLELIYLYSVMKNKPLLFVLSLLMISLIGFNISFINAETYN